MFVKQLSVFVENKTGRLTGILNILKDNNINIKALSIADTHDFGILRLIVDEPEKALDALKQTDCTASLTDLITIQIKNNAGALADIIALLAKEQIGIEYIYSIQTPPVEGIYTIVSPPTGSVPKNTVATIAIRVTDNEKAVEVFKKENVAILKSEDI